MKPLLSALNDIPEYRSLLAAIDNGACPAAFSGLSAVHRAHFAAGIRQELGRPVVVVCADEGEAALTQAGETTYRVGRIVAGEGEVRYANDGKLYGFGAEA